MRILFITRTHPHRERGAIEARLHDRLTELSELGHDVLVLTRWSGEAIDFNLPKRIEVRSPFKTFQAWEWPRSLPMVFAWRPDVLHIFDPGLTAIERTLSVEMMAMTMLTTLRRAARGHSSYHGGLVSIEGDLNRVEDSWKKAGAGIVENGWLRPSSGEHLMKPWDFASDRPLRVVLAGQVGLDVPIERVIEALAVMQRLDGFELTVFLHRASLSATDRRRLAQAERAEAFGAAVGSRLHLASPENPRDDLRRHDAAIIAGLHPKDARAWVEKLAIPVVVSESLKSFATEMIERGLGAQLLGRLVTELAPMSQAFAQILDRAQLEKAWLQIEQGALSSGRDVAANHVSRIYSQIARTPSPS